MTDQPRQPTARVINDESGEPFTGSLFVLNANAWVTDGRMDPKIAIETELDSATVAGLIPGFLHQLADLFEAQQKAGELEETFAQHDVSLAMQDLLDFDHDDEHEETP